MMETCGSLTLLRFLSKWDPSTNTELDSKVCAPYTTAQWIFDFIVNPILRGESKAKLLGRYDGLFASRRRILWEVATADTDVEESQRKARPLDSVCGQTLYSYAVLFGSTVVSTSLRQEF
jgi:hypothetical protein